MSEQTTEQPKRRPGRPRKTEAVVEPKSNGHKVVDLDALAVEVRAETEVTDPFYFSYKGSEWHLDPAVDADARLLVNTELSDTQQVMLYIKDLLGDEQWSRFPRISLSVALKLIEQYTEFSQGVDDLGESPA